MRLLLWRCGGGGGGGGCCCRRGGRCRQKAALGVSAAHLKKTNAFMLKLFSYLTKCVPCAEVQTVVRGHITRMPQGAGACRYSRVHTSEG